MCGFTHGWMWLMVFRPTCVWRNTPWLMWQSLHWVLRIYIVLENPSAPYSPRTNSEGSKETMYLKICGLQWISVFKCLAWCLIDVIRESSPSSAVDLVFCRGSLEDVNTSAEMLIDVMCRTFSWWHVHKVSGSCTPSYKSEKNDFRPWIKHTHFKSW